MNFYHVTDEDLEKLGVNFKLWELCKYQQSIINKYKEYIEKRLNQKIQDEIIRQPGMDPRQTTFYRQITIPEVSMITRCDPWVHRNWEILQAEHPLITPEYFISLAYREQKEKEDANPS